MSKFIRVFFFSNLFLGICAVTLCIETNLLFNIALNTVSFYSFIFLCTCIYYTSIYVRSVGAKNYDDRTIWYKNHISTITIFLKISVYIAIALAVYLLAENIKVVFSLSPLQIVLSVTFPIIAIWYTFSPVLLKVKTIRHTGWLKPFIIGLSWAGVVTFYPIHIGLVQMGKTDKTTLMPYVLLLLLNFLFFSVNAILFDIKDYRTDTFNRLKTYPVIFGVRNTFRFIVLPVLMLDIAAFTVFQLHQHFSTLQTFIQLIPHLLLVYVILDYRQQRGVLYYLAAVDGLVFVKAVCGIASILFINN